MVLVNNQLFSLGFRRFSGDSVLRIVESYMAMGHNLWLHFGVDEHPFATYFDVHQKYRVLTHSQMTSPTA